MEAGAARDIRAISPAGDLVPVRTRAEDAVDRSRTRGLEWHEEIFRDAAVRAERHREDGDDHDETLSGT